MNLTADGSVSGSWASDCASQRRGGRYARYYEFTLTRRAEVTVHLTSSVDTYLFLVDRPSKTRWYLERNDDIRGNPYDRNSRIVKTLAAGTYGIEATTYTSGEAGDFNLSVNANGAIRGPEVSLDASGPWPEGTSVTVTLTLSTTLDNAVTIPLTVTSGTSDDGDHGTLASITIPANSLTGSGTISTKNDDDGDDETFTVAIDTANLPSGVAAGSPVSQLVTITDIREGVTPPSIPIFPNPPATFTAQAGDKQVVLSWGEVLLATGWEVSKDNGATWTDTGSATTGYTATGLTNGTAYTFKVRAVRQLPPPFNTKTTGTASAAATATPAAPRGNQQGSDNEAPSFTSAADFNAAENQTAVATVTAVDDDAQETTVSFAVHGGADQSKFSITSAGVLTFKTAPDYENPNDAASATPADAAANNKYVVTVRATSGTGAREKSADQTIIVTVTDADDAPTGAPAISGTATVGQTLTAATSGIADQDGLTGPGWTYQWRRVEEGSDPTDISGATSSSYVLAAADQGKKVRVKVSFTDDENNAHSLVSADSGVIAASGAASDTAPRFTSGTAFNAAENQTAVTTVVAVDDDAQETSVTFALQDGADQSKFSITSAGALTFKANPDYENPNDAASTTPADGAANNKYVVTVRATSGTGAREKSADQTIIVTVTDADDAPTGAPAISGTETVGQTLTAATAGIADQDGLTTPGWTYQWRRVDGGTATDISGATGSTYVLAAADQGKKVRVKASFTDDENNAHSLESADSGVIAAADTATPPDAVANISVTHNGRSLTVSWDAPARATHYDVTYSGGGVNARAAWNRAGTSLTITCDSRPEHQGQNCVSPGTAYTVGIRARNSAGESAWADSAQTPLPSPPGAVTNIQVVHNGSSLTVTWDASDGATGYDVTYSGGGVNARAAWNRAGTGLTITCDSRDGTNCVSAGTTYTVGVRALNAGGESAWRDSAEVSHSEGG